MALAAKIPYDHPFAGGYPGIGSQPLPTDADAIDYLTRMATADGAGVEVGVAAAVSAFFRDLKATPGLFDAIKASCILCGARTITGALVPLAGPAPTAQGGWSSGDYSRTAGLTGDGNALYLDANRAGDADPQNDYHASVYCTLLPGTASSSAYISCVSPGSAVGATLISRTSVAPNDNVFRVRSSTNVTTSASDGLIAGTRSSDAEFTYWDGTSEVTQAATSETRPTRDHFIFAHAEGASLHSDATIAFYSIGTSLSLAALDTAVTNLITAIGEAL